MGAGTCGVGFWAVDWPNITKVRRRCCTILSTFVTAAATRGGIWGVGGWGVEGGACPWLGEGRGVLEGWALGWGRCTKGSRYGPMISGVSISPFVSESSGSYYIAAPSCIV